MHRLKCAEVWGGIKDEELDACSRGLTVGLFSSACTGGKGGDVYYFSLCSADRVTRIALADVVGHGEQVSHVSQWVYEQMAARLDEWDLPIMMAGLNQKVVEAGFKAMTTATILSFYHDLRQVYYCYAGHPPILLRSRGDHWRELEIPAGERTENLPLGVTGKTSFQMSDVVLNPGDILLLYTDGVLEAPAPGGELFGLDRLQGLLRKEASAAPFELKSKLLTSLRSWTGGPLDHDDVTFLAVEVA